MKPSGKIRTMPEDDEIGGIEKYRQEIDEIDGEMLRMLNRRAECALLIGHIKKRHNLPIHVPEREEKVIDRLTSLNEGPVPAEAVRQIFQTIFTQMRELEEAGE